MIVGHPDPDGVGVLGLVVEACRRPQDSTVKSECRVVRSTPGTLPSCADLRSRAEAVAVELDRDCRWAERSAPRRHFGTSTTSRGALEPGGFAEVRGFKHQHGPSTGQHHPSILQLYNCTHLAV